VNSYARHEFSVSGRVTLEASPSSAGRVESEVASSQKRGAGGGAGGTAATRRHSMFRFVTWPSAQERPQ